MKKIFLLLIVLLSFNLSASEESAAPTLVACTPASQGRGPASAEECTSTATELMSVKTEQAQFAKICKEIIKSDPACLKLKPEKRLKCTNQDQNTFKGSAHDAKDNFTRIYQCIKGFAWDSMVELGKFVIDMIKTMANGVMKNKEDILRFMVDSNYRTGVLAKGASKYGKLTKAFLSSSAMYFSREYAKNLVLHPTNPMAAVGKTLFEPLMKFLSEAVTSMIAEYTPQWHCMNGAAKLNTVCRIAGEFVMPPAFVFGFMKNGIVGLKALSKSPAVGRFIKNFTAMNQVVDKTEDAVDLALDAKKIIVDSKLAKTSSQVAKSSAPAVVKRAEQAKDITKHTDKELVQLARNERKLATKEGGIPPSLDDIKAVDNVTSVPKDPKELAKAFPQTSDVAKSQLKLKPDQVQKLITDINSRFPAKVSDDDIALMINQFSKQGAKTSDDILKHMDELQIAKVENPALFAKDGIMNQGALAGESEMTKLLYVDEISKRGIPRRDPAGNFKVGKNGKVERQQLPKDRIERQKAINQEMKEFSKAVDCKI